MYESTRLGSYQVGKPDGKQLCVHIYVAASVISEGCCSMAKPTSGSPLVLQGSWPSSVSAAQ